MIQEDVHHLIFVVHMEIHLLLLHVIHMEIHLLPLHAILMEKVVLELMDLFVQLSVIHSTSLVEVISVLTMAPTLELLVVLVDFILIVLVDSILLTLVAFHAQVRFLALALADIVHPTLALLQDVVQLSFQPAFLAFLVLILAYSLARQLSLADVLVDLMLLVLQFD